tara:strand:- start:280 stop:546 length:267 start_codon:yes stop_codon:yes gene_type:complete
MEIRKMFTKRDQEDYDDLQNIISEVYEKWGHKHFMDEDIVELADETKNIIRESSDYRYLRLFSVHEIEAEIESFRNDIEEINRLKREG